MNRLKQMKRRTVPEPLKDCAVLPPVWALRYSDDLLSSHRHAGWAGLYAVFRGVPLFMPGKFLLIGSKIFSALADHLWIDDKRLLCAEQDISRSSFFVVRPL